MSPEKKNQIREFIDSLNKQEQAWTNGYLDGILNGVPAAGSLTVKAGGENKKITIAYGTESGNSKKIANIFASRAKQEGIHAKLVSLDQYRLSDLAKEEYFLTVISTQGEGEPPASAKKFYDHIHQNGFKLPQMKYGVLALGDTSYPLFCKAGEDVDEQLQRLGGQRLIPLHKCDTDYHSTAESWFSQVMQQLGSAPQQQIQIVQPKKISSGKKINKGQV